MFKKLFKFLRKHKKAVALLSLGLLIFIAPEIAHAESVAETTEQSIATTVQIALKFLNQLLWPVLLIIGELMDSDIIIGPGMEETLRSIWVQIRNLVNIGFVVVLMVIAFYNILGINQEGNLALKTALPKLIIGLILVNFTFVASKALLDVANIATTAAFAIPQSVEGVGIGDEAFSFEDHLLEFERNSCLKEYTVDEDTGVGVGTKYSSSDEISPLTQIVCEADEDGNYTGDLNPLVKARFFTNLNANNIGLIMAMNQGALDDLALVSGENVTNFSDLLINSIFAIVMFLVFAVSYIVLAVVLIFRIIVIWVAIAFSPVLVLFYVVPELKEAAGGGGDLVSKVTKHIIAPILIGLVLSVGFIMIGALNEVADAAIGITEGTQINELLDSEFLLTGIGDLQHLIIAIASIVVVWTGIFAAANGTYADTIIGGIQSFGENAAKFVAKSPVYLPIIPIRTADGEETKPVSAAAFGTFSDLLQDKLVSGQIFGQPDLTGQVARFAPGLVGGTSEFERRNANFDQQSNTGKQAFFQDFAARAEVSQADAVAMASRMAAQIRAEGKNKIANYETVARNLETAARVGNVQELQNIIRREVATAPGARTQELFGLDQAGVKKLAQNIGQSSASAANQAQATEENQEPNPEQG